MKLDKSQSVGYSDLFDGNEELPIPELLRGIPSRTSLVVVAHFSAQIHIAERDNTRQLRLLQLWAGRIPPSTMSKLNQLLYEIRQSDTKLNFINNISLLLLAEHVLANFNELEAVENLTPLQELQLLKVYLLGTDQWTSKQKIGDENPNSNAGLAKLLIKIQFPYQEILELKDFRPQFIKASYFFTYCESHLIFRDYLKIFLKENNSSTWKEYLSHLLSTYVRKFEEQHTPSILTVNDQHKQVQEFLRQFCIDPNTFVKSDDFLNLREKPLYEIGQNTFAFLSLILWWTNFFRVFSLPWPRP